MHHQLPRRRKWRTRTEQGKSSADLVGVTRHRERETVCCSGKKVLLGFCEARLLLRMNILRGKSLPFESPFEEVEEENPTTWKRCWDIALGGPFSDPSGTWTNLPEIFLPPSPQFSGAHWPPRSISWAAHSDPLCSSSGPSQSPPPPSATFTLDAIPAPGNLCGGHFLMLPIQVVLVFWLA